MNSVFTVLQCCKKAPCPYGAPWWPLETEAADDCMKSILFLSRCCTQARQVCVNVELTGTMTTCRISSFQTWIVIASLLRSLGMAHPWTMWVLWNTWKHHQHRSSGVLCWGDYWLPKIDTFWFLWIQEGLLTKWEELYRCPLCQSCSRL